MQTNTDTQSRIEALKAQIAVVRQERESIHRTIQDRLDRGATSQGRVRAFSLLLTIPVFAIIGILGGYLLARAQVGIPGSETPSQMESNHPGDMDEIERASGTEPLTTAPEEAPSHSEVNRDAKPRDPNRRIKRIGRGVPKSKTPSKPKDELDFSDCGDDPLCGRGNMGR